MKILNALKLFCMVLGISLAVGCASTTDETKPTEEAPPAETAPPAEQPPAVEPQPVVEEPVVSSMESDYTVERGDSLWGISAKPSVYGNPYQWPLIYKANSDKIKDADLIYPGQVLGIETNPSASDVSAAVQHAKTRGSWSIGVMEDSDKAYLAQ